MGNKNAKKINQDYESEQRRIGQSGDKYDNYIYDNLPGARDHKNDIWNKRYQTSGDILSGKYPGSMAGGGGTGGSGFGQYENYFKNFGSGVDENAQNRIRGNGVFDEFSKTGGLSDAQRQDFRQRGTSVVPRFYDAIGQELARTKAAQGGYAPGFDAQMAKIAREKTQAGQDATLNTETDLTNMINEGRKWGAGNVSSSEMGLQDLMNRNKMQSMSQAMQAHGLDNDFGLKQNDQALKWAQLGLGDLSDLYSATPGEENMYLGRLNESRGIQGSQAANLLGGRAAYNPNKSFMDYLQQGANIGGSLLSAFGPTGQNPFKTGRNSTSRVSQYGYGF